MVMAILWKTYFRLEAQNLRTVFTHVAIHGVVACEDAGNTVRHGGQHQGVVIEVIGLDELGILVAIGDQIRKAVDAVDQDARKQEVRKYDNPLETELHHLL